METTRLHKLFLSLLVLGVTAALTGCGQKANKQAPKKPAATPVAVQEGNKDAADATPGLAELSDADRAIAEKQKVCPVSGDRLGAMGKPIKITVKGQVVFLCCPSCEEPIKKDPDKYASSAESVGRLGRETQFESRFSGVFVTLGASTI